MVILDLSFWTFLLARWHAIARAGNASLRCLSVCLV